MDVSVNGHGEKRQMTATPSTTAAGTSLLFQLRHRLLVALQPQLALLYFINQVR
jgi:hypothetical protein